MGEHSMKINGSTESIRSDLATGKPAAKSAASGVGRAGDAPTVRLSDVSASLAPGEGQAEFDASKVAQIKDAIREGRFEVNSGVVADKLIENVNQLFGKVH